MLQKKALTFARSLHTLKSAQPIEFSLVSALKHSSSSLVSAAQIHAFAVKLGLDHNNLFVRNALTNSYGKCGNLDAAHFLFGTSPALDTASWNTMLVCYVKSNSFDDARKLFDEMPSRDCVSFTTMIMGFSQNNLSGEALLLFRDMVADGVSPNEVTLATVLSSCCSLGCSNSYFVGKLVQSMATKTGLGSFVLVGTNLVNWYAVMNDLESSKMVFDEMPDKNTVAWNAMLNGYAKAGMIKLAEDLFRCIPTKDMISWSTMVDAYLRVGMLEKALLGYSEMLRRVPNSRPNEVILVDLISSCSRYAALREGGQLHAVAEKAGLSRHYFVQATLIHLYAACKKIHLACILFRSFGRENVSCWNALLSGFLRNGMVDDAKNLFQEMPDRDVFSWSILISGYVQFNRPDLALSLSYDMIRHNVKPNEVTLVSILSAVASCGSPEQGKSVHSYVVKNTGYVPLTDNLIAALIDMYAKRGSIRSASKVFTYHNHSTASLSSASPWNALICGLAMHGHANMSLEVFADMIAGREVKPNAVTFIGVLSACCHAGLVSAGRQHFASMKRVYGIEPSIKHYGCMVDLLGRAGCLEDAERLVMEMPMEADVVIWGSMVANARTHGDVEVGARAAERLARLDASHGAGRVLLSNIYADANRWEDVFVVRSGMQQQERLVRVPGISGIL